MSDISHIVQTTKDLVGFQSLHDDQEGLKKCAEYIADFFVNTNVTVHQLESNGVPSIVVTKKNKTPKLFLAGHFDVVGAPKEDFVVKEESGKLFGRGVFDMKGALAIYMHLMREYADSDHDFGLLFVGDEEIGGSDGTEYVLSSGFHSDVVLMADGGMNVQTMVRKEKGLLRIFLKAKGKSAHGSRPWEGKDANMAVARAMCQIQDMFLPLRELPDDRWVSTCNFGYIQGGHILNQVSDYAEAHMDVRVIEDDDPDMLHTKIQDMIPEDIELYLHAKTPAVAIDVDSEYVQTYREILKDVTGRELSFVDTHGSSDARYFSKKGAAVIMTQPDGGNHHADNEWVSIQGLSDYYQIVKRYIQALV